MINPDSKFIVFQFGHLLGDGWHECDAATYEQEKAKGTRVRRLAVMPEYHITARSYFGSNGGEFVAELRNVQTGNIEFGVKGSGTSSAWEYSMRDAMAAHPELFPAHDGMNATRYFRELCNVPYDYREVSRKRDL